MKPQNKTQFILIPVPFEATVSYGKGTKRGPAAILQALKQVETFDEELFFEAEEAYNFAMAGKVAKPAALVPLVKKIILEGKIPVVLGGEHSITPYAVKAAAAEFKDLSVLQIDAHADLRDSYQGSKNSHACAMRRVLEIAPLVQVGIRNVSKAEFEYAQKSGQIKKIHFLNPNDQIPNLPAEALAKAGPNKVLGQLSDHVYVTIDVDGLDPSIMPATGTPEPGGLLWNDLLNLLRVVAEKKRIVGFDLVEFAPIKGLIAPDFVLAKLLRKLMNYIHNLTRIIYTPHKTLRSKNPDLKSQRQRKVV